MSIVLAVLVVCGALGQAIDDAVLPPKTEIYVVMKRGIDTSVARHGDRFHAEVEVPVTLDDQIIIPPGSYVLGVVDLSKKAGRIKGKAKLKLLFDTIILPDGTTRKVEAVVQSAEGNRTDATREDGTLEGKGSQGAEVGVDATRGSVGGATIGAIAGRDWKDVGIGAGVGAGVGALVGLLRRGGHVYIPRGAGVTIQLDTPVRFVRPEPPAPRRPIP